MIRVGSFSPTSAHHDRRAGRKAAASFGHARKVVFQDQQVRTQAINKCGRKQWLAVEFCLAAVWVFHAARRMRDDYRATCEGKPTLDGYRAYLRRECQRDIARDPGLLVWFDDLTADAWTRRRWTPSMSGA
jgi:hypothetical protein